MKYTGMSTTFKEIKRLVVNKQLDNIKGFSGADIRKATKIINDGTASTFIWKHADNAGKIPKLYFTQLSNGKYQIRKEHL